MPSANPKLEKQASTEAVDPIRQAVIVIEHKIRNLEKRKGRIQSYKDTTKNGKELEQEQKAALAKYDQVLQTLEITRELYKQIVAIANDSAKQQKKLARKEALERTQQDIAKVREVLLIQDTLLQMGDEAIRKDFLQGAKGANKLTEEELEILDNLFKELSTTRQTQTAEQPTFPQQVQKAAEHLVAIIDGKQREFIGTTYVKVKEVIASINQSSYFEQAPEVQAISQEATDAPTEARVSNAQAPDQSAEEYNAGDVHIPAPETMIQNQNFSVQVAQLPVVSGPTPVSGPIPVVAQPIPPHPAAPVDTSYYVNAPSFVPQSQQPQQQPQQQQQVVQPQLQQQPQQPPQQQQQQQQLAQAPRINDVIGTPDFFFLQESELDSPDVGGQSAPIPHIPPINAPIPSQTFTNQSFGAPVQVIYQHPPTPQDMSHIPGFANPNPPPPIPMPPSHQQQNLSYSPQHPTAYQQQQPQTAQQLQQQQPPPPQTHQHQQPQPQQQQYDASAHQQDTQQQSIEDKIEQGQERVASGEQREATESVDWSQMTEQPLDEWAKPDVAGQDSSAHLSQQQSQPFQPGWGEAQRGVYNRGRPRRGNSNGYVNRGRVGGSGGFQQNNRGSSAQAAYFRNDTGHYQNGYQQRNYNDGNAGFNGFKRGGGGGGTSGSRGGSRGERSGMDRSGGSRGGQYRGSQRGSNRSGSYMPSRGKSQQAQQ